MASKQNTKKGVVHVKCTRSVRSRCHGKVFAVRDKIVITVQETEKSGYPMAMNPRNAIVGGQ